MTDGEILLTAAGYKKIKDELEEIYTVTKPRLSERIRQARLLGDLRENADYHDAKHAQALLETRINQLKLILGKARVVEDSEAEDGVVTLGSVVRVVDIEMDEEEEYTIVGIAEADPMAGKISSHSAMGTALMGKQVGDEVEVNAPGGVIHYRIVSVG